MSEEFASTVELGEPLLINKLNVPEFVNTLIEKNISFTDSKIYPLHPRQVDIVKDEARFKSIACGRRFGKSILCALIGAAVAMQPGRKIWVVSNTYELTDRVFARLFDLIVNKLKLAKSKSRRQRYIILKNGSEIYGKSCDNRESLVGEGLDLIIWDECGLTVNGADIWNQELRATLTDREGSALFISTPRGKNHFYNFYLDGQRGMALRKRAEEGEPLSKDEKIEATWSSFKFSSYSNTKENGGFLKKAEIDAARLKMPPLKFRQEYLADFNAAADRAFPEFNSEIQVGEGGLFEFSIKRSPTFCGVDFNYSTPCTTLYGQMDTDLNVYIFDEFHPPEAHTSSHMQAKQLLSMDQKLQESIAAVVADIAGKQKGLDGRSGWDDFNAWGIFPVGRKQKIETGCDLIRLWCSYPVIDHNGIVAFEEDNLTPKTYSKLFIHKRCKSLIFALEAAKAPESQGGVLKEGYQKDGVTDGPLDALRYLLVWLLHDSGYVGIIPAH